jgi:hypothetical protein
MILFDHGIGGEYIIREAFSIVLIQCDQSVGFQNIRVKNVYLLPVGKSFGVGGCVLRLRLLKVSEAKEHMRRKRKLTARP